MDLATVFLILAAEKIKGIGLIIFQITVETYIPYQDFWQLQVFSQ